jgi:hypothetical protein
MPRGNKNNRQNLFNPKIKGYTPKDITNTNQSFGKTFVNNVTSGIGLGIGSGIGHSIVNNLTKSIVPNENVSPSPNLSITCDIIFKEYNQCIKNKETSFIEMDCSDFMKKAIEHGC